MTEKELLNMKLHETRDISTAYQYMNVTGVYRGWIYTIYSDATELAKSVASAAVFVPEENTHDEEF